MEAMTESSTRPVIFFDGVCGLCNTFVDFLLTVDKKKKLRFAPLQGKTFEDFCADPVSAEMAKPFLNQVGDTEGTPKFTSVFYWEHTSNGGILRNESDAALKAIASLGGPWSVVAVFRIIPKFIRNYVYKIVSKNRYKWFGKKESCRLPSPEERERFLP